MVVLYADMPESFFWTRTQAGIGFSSPLKKVEQEEKPHAVDLRKLELNPLLPEGDMRVPFLPLEIAGILVGNLQALHEDGADGHGRTVCIG